MVQMALVWIALIAALPATLVAQPSPSAPAAPEVSAVSLTEAISLDGILSEAVWRTAPAAGDFTQQSPIDGAPATQPTEVRFAFSADALYVGARMYDSLGVAGVTTRLTRRDQTAVGDYLQLIFDTFHDHAGRTILQVNPSGVKYDAGQASANADVSWEPVWETATAVDSLGWTAELRIPLSQLRFPTDASQVWGLQIWRYVERSNETSMWSYWSKTDVGGPQRFGHLNQIAIRERPRGFELLPYTTVRASYLEPTQSGSPFNQAGKFSVLAGGEMKALLTSTLTLDAAVNPDFGQVEVDPAVVNLSAFETFLPEKRPFFVEGSGLFGFGGLSCYFCSNASGMSLFYSRRIGRRPQGSVPDDARFSDVPESSRLLAATKITGRTANDWQIGLLTALTAQEKARTISAEGVPGTIEVEPLTNYFVGRVRRTWLGGDLTIGGIGTSVLRRFDSAELEEHIPTVALAAGVDWQLRFLNRQYSFTGNLALSSIGGNAAAIDRLQRSSARYFARPDRSGGSNGFLSNRYDPAAERLRGLGGYARLSKDGGNVLWETTVNFRTPGFEVNDAAFQTLVDYIWMNANIMRVWAQPTRHYRRLQILAGGQQQFNFDGDRTGREGRLSFYLEALNYWQISSFVIARTRNLDDRLTRGGPVVGRPGGWFASFDVSTDARRALSLSVNPSLGRGNGRYQNVSVALRLRPVSNVSVTLSPRYFREVFSQQFVKTFADSTATNFHEQRVVFADITQKGLSMETRLAVTFSPTLTLELYAQPLISSGRYTRFKEFSAPRAITTLPFDQTQIRPVLGGAGEVASYDLDPDRNPLTPAFSLTNPDFNLRSLRGNAVIRWEYRPGSTFYFVWQQSRSGRDVRGNIDVMQDIPGLLDGKPNDVFLIKGSYWIGS